MKHFCDWLGGLCRNPAAAYEDGFWHCQPHLYEHRRLVNPVKPGPLKGQRAKCGTRSGHQAHWRLSEPACQPCKNAEADYQRDRRHRKRSA